MNFKVAVLLFCALLTKEAKCGTTSLLGATPIGKECESEADCVAAGKSECLPEGSPTRRVCKCRADYVPKLDNLDCLELRRNVGEACLENQQCAVAGTLCIGNPGSKRCLCTFDFIPHPTDPTKCNKLALIGEPCNQHDNQCEELEGGATCQGPPGNRVCTCPPNTIPDSDRFSCLRPATGLGEPCEDVTQCRAAVPNSVCVGPRGARTCQCHADFIPPPGDRSRCNRRALIGGPCNEHISQCSIDHSFCTGLPGASTCACASTHVSNRARTKCLEKAELDKACEESAQCSAAVQFSECSGWGENRKCGCSWGYIPPPYDKWSCNRLATSVGGFCEGHPNQCQDLYGTICTNTYGARTCECLPGSEEKSWDQRGCYTKDSSDEYDDDLSPLLIGLIVVGGLAGVAVVVGVIYFVLKRRGRVAM